MLIASTSFESLLAPVASRRSGRRRPESRSRVVDALVWPSTSPATGLVPTPGDRRLGTAIEALRRRHGHGRTFVQTFRNHQLLRLSRLVGDCPDGAVPLWLLGAVAVRATRSQLADLNRHGAVRRVEPMARASVTSPSTHRELAELAGLCSRARRGVPAPIGLLDTGVDPATVRRFAGLSAFNARGRRMGGPFVDRHGHGTAVAASLVERGIEAPVVASRVLPGGTGTVAQVVAGLQWALEQGCVVIVTPLGRYAFDPVWHHVSSTLTAAGVSWIVAADEGVGDEVRPTIHLPVVGCFRSGPLRTRVPVGCLDAEVAGDSGSAIDLATSLDAEGPITDPLELARRIWATGGSATHPSPSWAA